MNLLAQAGEDIFPGLDVVLRCVCIGLVLTVGLLCWLVIAVVHYLRRQRCGHCGKVNTPEARYCNQCGVFLTKKRAA